MGLLDLFINHGRPLQESDTTLDLTDFHRARQQQQRERSTAEWNKGPSISPAQMTAALNTISRQMTGRAVYPKGLDPDKDSLPKRVMVQLFGRRQFRPGSAGDLQYSHLHKTEKWLDMNMPQEMQDAVFNGRGIERASGSPNYGYRPGTSEDQSAAFPAPLTESIAHRIALASYNKTAGKRKRKVVC